MKYNDRHFRRAVIGMPDSHAVQFARMAKSQQCVIVSRAVGPSALGLLEEGYDTKGFRIHGKSCDWGPMAGFVLRDPRLNKDPGRKTAYNTREHLVALTDSNNAGWSAQTVPLRITDERIRWLKTRTDGEQIRTTNFGITGELKVQRGRAQRGGVTVEYELREERIKPLTADSPSRVWGVWIKGGFGASGPSAWVRLHAMTNPPGHRSWPGEDFRNAVTGDYDLFAVWPWVKDYDRDGDDRRALGTQRGRSGAKLMAERETVFDKSGHSTKLGNLTNRIYRVGQFLNSGIGATTSPKPRGGAWGPFPLRNVVWHSDEGGRPFVGDVDLPLIMFTPYGNEFGVETITDFQALVVTCINTGFRITLNDGWVNRLGETSKERLPNSFMRLVPDDWATGRVIQPDWLNA